MFWILFFFAIVCYFQAFANLIKITPKTARKYAKPAIFYAIAGMVLQNLATVINSGLLF